MKKDIHSLYNKALGALKNGKTVSKRKTFGVQMARTEKKFYQLAHAAVASGVKDNSYGAGYWPLPARLANIQTFITSSNKIVKTHTVFPDTNMHMFTTNADTRFSIVENDLMTLIRLGFVGIRVNEPGKIAIYFKGEPWKTSDWK